MEIKVRVKGGLANRMRVLSSCLNLHRDFDVKVQIHWENNSYLNCPYDRLFQPIEGLEIIDYPLLKARQKMRRLIRNRQWRVWQKRSDLYLEDGMDFNDLKNRISSSQRVFIYSCQRFYGEDSSLRQIKALPWISSLAAKRVNEIGGEYTGLHIRRGDNAKAIAKSPLDLFKDKMDELIAAGELIYLCSDSNQVLKQFKTAHKDKIIANLHKENRADAESIEQALIDFIMLSKSKEIYASYWSSFSEEAAVYGSTSHKVLSI